MEQVLIDTDIVIDFLRGHQKRIQNFFQKVELGEIKVYLSAVSLAELYYGIQDKDQEQTAALENFLIFLEILPVEKQTAKNAGILKRKYELGLSDSLIAASALENGLQIFTFNAKHFRKIKELKLWVK